MEALPDKFLCSYHMYIPAYSKRLSDNSSTNLNDNASRPGLEAKNSAGNRGRRPSDSVGRGPFQIVRTDRKMVPEQITESVAVVKVPNYDEKYVASLLDLSAMKRFNDKVCFEPSMAPVHYAQTLICYKNSTRKRYVSRTFYEPRVKPKRFAETTILYPKQPDKCFVSFLDYHIDECRKWFRTCLEFKAKTYTTTKIGLGKENGPITRSSKEESYSTDDSPGASQVFIPRFNTDGSPYERKFKFNIKPDINQNTRVRSINGY